MRFPFRKSTQPRAPPRPRFARSVRVDDRTLYIDDEPFPFYITEGGPSVETLVAVGRPLHVVTLAFFVEGDVTNITRETRETTLEELLRDAEQRLAVARKQAEALAELGPPDA